MSTRMPVQVNEKFQTGGFVGLIRIIFVITFLQEQAQRSAVRGSFQKQIEANSLHSPLVCFRGERVQEQE